MVSVAKGEMPVGLDLGGHEYEITPELVASTRPALDDHHAWYTSRRSAGVRPR